MAVQAGLCRTWSETLKTGFLITRLIRRLPQEKDHTAPKGLHCLLFHPHLLEALLHVYCLNLRTFTAHLFEPRSEKTGLQGPVVTEKLICVIVFAYAKSWFSHDEAHLGILQ